MKNTARYLPRITCSGRTGLIAAITGFLVDKEVKAIGTAAHYAIADLDEGPVIYQDVVRVDHTSRPDQLLATAPYMENYVQPSAVKAHSEHCVFLNAHKAVVLK
jgi:formyltetrahydrofolate deformylase